MSHDVGCSDCGWTGNKKEMLRLSCPECGCPLHDMESGQINWNWRAIAVGLFLSTLLGGYALLPESGRVYMDLVLPDRFGSTLYVQYIDVLSAAYEETPQGTQFSCQVVNRSRLTLAELQLSLRVFPFPADERLNRLHAEFGQQLPDVTIENLKPGAAVAIRRTLPDSADKELLGWKAKIESYRLPSGYWNRELEKSMIFRTFGHSGNVPHAFSQHNQLGSPKQKLQFR